MVRVLCSVFEPQIFLYVPLILSVSDVMLKRYGDFRLSQVFAESLSLWESLLKSEFESESLIRTVHYSEFQTDSVKVCRGERLDQQQEDGR